MIVKDINMNIFVLDLNTTKAAQYHCDRHCVKMILESCQMLSTAINLIVPSHTENLYKTTHINHPCSIWVRKSKQNFKWLINLAEELSKEYTIRYNKQHKCNRIIDIAKKYIDSFPDIGLTQFALAMPDQFKSSDIVHSYRLYCAASKHNFSTWKTVEPDWWQTYRNYIIVNNLEITNDKNDYVTV